MRRKTLLQTLIFIGILFAVPFLVPVAKALPDFLPLVWLSGIIALLLFSAYYIIKVKKSSLFCLFAVLLILTAIPSVAQKAPIDDQKLLEQDKQTILSYRNEVCGGKDGKGKGETFDYNPKTLEKAHKVVDLYNKITGGGSSFGGHSDIEYVYKCAETYIEHAGEAQKTAATTCNPVSFLLKQQLEKNDCWPCDITALVINSIQKMAVAAYEVVNDAAIALLGGIFLMWIAVSLLIFFGKFGFSRFSEFFTQMLNQAILVIIVALILHAPIVNFYRIVISPFVTYTSGLAIEFSKVGVEGTNNSVFTLATKMLGLSPSQCSYCNSMAGETELVTAGQFMDTNSVNGMLCMVCTVYRQVSPMISLGQAMTCYASALPKALAQVPQLSTISLFATPNFSVLMVGYLITILFSLLMFVIGFYIMGAMMKLGFLLILTPLFLVAFTFKFSRQYSKQAWVLIIHSMVTLLALSLAISLLLIGFNNLLPAETLQNFLDMLMSDNPQGITGAFAGAMTDTSMQQITSGDVTGMAQNPPSFGSLLFLSYAFIALQILDGSSTIVERLAGAYIDLGKTGVSQLAMGAGFGLQAAQSSVKAGAHITKMGGEKAKNMLTGDSSSQVPAWLKNLFPQKPKGPDDGGSAP